MYLPIVVLNYNDHYFKHYLNNEFNILKKNVILSSI